MPTPPPQPAASRPSPLRRHIAGLDGLRAIAVAAVIAYHFLPGLLPGGFVGVDVFFVVSGFLITTLLLDEREANGRISLGSFWQRRARRLLPALVVLILVCCTFVLTVRGDLLVRLGRQVVGALTFSSNWLFIAQNSNYFGQGAPQLFRNLWSLAVEEQFYVLWPLALIALVLIRSSGIRFAVILSLAAVSAIEMAALYSPANPSRVYYGSDTHSFGLMIGAALAILVRWEKPLNVDYGETGWQHFCRKNAGWIGFLSLGGLLASLWFVSDTSAITYRGGLLLVSVLTAAVIWAATRRKALLGRALDVAPLKAVGKRSYGLYLWHWPVLVLIQAAIPGWTTHTAGQWMIAALALSITIPVAELSYRYVETPIRRNGLRALRMPGPMFRARSRGAVVGAAIAGVLVLTAGVSTATAIASSTTQTTAQRYIERGERAIADAEHANRGHATENGRETHPDRRNTASPAPTPPASPLPSATPSASATAQPAGDGGPSASTVPLTLLAPQSGAQITAIGDSVMLASAPELEAEFPGIAINAVVSRQAREAPGIIQSLAAQGQLRQTLVIGLGTNGFLGTGTLQAIRTAAGPSRNIVFVNIFANREWQAEVDTDLASYVSSDPHAALADWHDAIAAHTDLLAPDQIHPGSAGGAIYANCVALALAKFGG